jgi:hypothetical protein
MADHGDGTHHAAQISNAIRADRRISRYNVVIDAVAVEDNLVMRPL